jgi:D-alanine-D-alanine ligase
VFIRVHLRLEVFVFMARNYGKVVVLMGGPSAEREVSLKSGAAVLAALKRRGVDAHGLDVGPDVLTRLAAGKYHRAFIALHGRLGEDGVIQGALEVLGLPYTGSGVLGSALGMDKRRCKHLWSATGVPTPEFVVLEAGGDFARAGARLGFPVFVKPACEGSSIGVSKVRRAEELPAAWEKAAKYDACVLAERFIDGPEITAALLGDRVLPLIRIETPREFYDYEAKYLTDDTRYVCPSGLDAAAEKKAQQLARAAFEALGCSGWGRVDFMLDKGGHPYVLEVNTVPGMTDHSLVPKAARAAGIEFEELVLRILETSFSHDKANERNE